jgi:hypothetical protein
MRTPRRTIAVALALAGVVLAASAASAQALFRADSLEVYDSTGKKVGTVAQSNAPYSMEVVFRTGSGHTLFVNVSPSGFWGTVTRVWFVGRGCLGAPFIEGYYGGGYWGRQPSSALIGPRKAVYVQAGTFRATRMRMRSYLEFDGVCWNTDDRNPPVREFFAPAQRLALELADYFTPPFTLRATATGEPIPTGTSADSLERTDGLVVFDSTGKKVAPAMAYAVVTDSGVTISLADVNWWYEDVLYFESTDCTGPAFVSVSGASFTATTFSGPRRTVYQPEAVQTRTMYSAAYEGGCEVLRTRRGPQWWVNGRQGAYGVAVSLGIDLDDYFTPPFVMRAGKATRALPD